MKSQQKILKSSQIIHNKLNQSTQISKIDLSYNLSMKNANNKNIAQILAQLKQRRQHFNQLKIRKVNSNDLINCKVNKQNNYFYQNRKSQIPQFFFQYNKSDYFRFTNLQNLSQSIFKQINYNQISSSQKIFNNIKSSQNSIVNDKKDTFNKNLNNQSETNKNNIKKSLSKSKSKVNITEYKNQIKLIEEKLKKFHQQINIRKQIKQYNKIHYIKQSQRIQSVKESENLIKSQNYNKTKNQNFQKQLSNNKKMVKTDSQKYLNSYKDDSNSKIYQNQTQLINEKIEQMGNSRKKMIRKIKSSQFLFKSAQFYTQKQQNQSSINYKNQKEHNQSHINTKIKNILQSFQDKFSDNISSFNLNEQINKNHQDFNLKQQILKSGKIQKKPRESSSKKMLKQTFQTNYTLKPQKFFFTHKQLKISDFQLGKQLGKGKFGKVLLCRHKTTGFFLAIKFIQKSIIVKKKSLQQLTRQIKIQSIVNHCNNVKMYGFFNDSKFIYLLLQYCSQGQLYSLLKCKQRFKEEEAIPIIKDICQGIEYLHSNNIIHRDIKPQNVVICNKMAKLCDFGWSVNITNEKRQTFCGTPLYVSPQLLNGEKYDYKVDSWALGVLTYQILTGNLPFSINSQSQLTKILNSTIRYPGYLSSKAVSFISHLLQKDPNYRNDIYTTLEHPFLSEKDKKNR